MATPNPIPFSVAATLRPGGSFQTGALTYPGGYSNIYFEIAIPLAVDYQNPANEIIINKLVNGVVNGTATWVGNASQATPPLVAVQWDITQMKAGDTIAAQGVINPVSLNAITCGIANGLVS